jgi:organic radical activating enzyme
MHAAHACNLTCASCAHFSDSGHKGFVRPDEADAWMRSWRERIAPRCFGILGGEPTLNPHLPELIELAAGNWRRSTIALTSNGFFLHRHPELPKLLHRHKVILRLTVHDRSDEYAARLQEIMSLIAAWRKRWSFRFSIEEAYERWTRRYHGFAAAVLPYEDGDPRRSWEACPCKNCMQLFRGRLWKCSPIAYLRLQKEAYPEISAKWDPYLAYAGLAADCSDGELAAFVRREDEPICGMCAVKPERFNKPSPLIPRSALRRDSR